MFKRKKNTNKPKNRSEREVHSDTGLSQEINNLTYHAWELTKEQSQKPAEGRK